MTFQTHFVSTTELQIVPELITFFIFLLCFFIFTEILINFCWIMAHLLRYSLAGLIRRCVLQRNQETLKRSVSNHQKNDLKFHGHLENQFHGKVAKILDNFCFRGQNFYLANLFSRVLRKFALCLAF